MSDFDVLIVGAGLSGIASAYHLQQRCPGRSFAILEARQSIGGTWDLFRYPGIRSDSDMFTFGFSFSPWQDGKIFADGPNILEYIRRTARENDIDARIQFGRRVLSANWDGAKARWEVMASVDGGDETASYTANFLMVCSGYYRYDRGHFPSFTGVEDFEGEVIHPQHWPEGYDYAGKKVVVIGSGATAVTLVPAMAPTAAHVTMLQRSPSYVASRPSRSALADGLRRVFPDGIVHALVRTKNILYMIFVYEMSRRSPERVKNEIMRRAQKELGDDFDVETHFSPSYGPWDERLCLCPDGDLFKVLRDGSASIVTDHIETFTESGIALRSGQHIEADLVIAATGLELLMFGGMEISIGGEPYALNENFTYRGMMLSNLPNLAVCLGYTNSSWTLKVDLTCERVCRTLNHMERHGFDTCVATPPTDIDPEPIIDFRSGYVQRVIEDLPRQGRRSPWRTHQNYIKDMLTIRYSGLRDGHLSFSRSR